MDNQHGHRDMAVNCHTSPTLTNHGCLTAADEAATLHWTQLAVIDFLVLANAEVRRQGAAACACGSRVHVAQSPTTEGRQCRPLQGLVTFDPSTFSSYLVEYRLLQMGVPRETATCVLGLCEQRPGVEVRLRRWTPVGCLLVGALQSFVWLADVHAVLMLQARVVANGILFDTFEELAGAGSLVNATTWPLAPSSALQQRGTSHNGPQQVVL
jgi:hypothetical protein